MILGAVTKYKRSQHAILTHKEVLTYKVAKQQSHFLHTKKDDAGENLDSKEVENVVNSQLQAALNVIERVQSRRETVVTDDNDESLSISSVEDSPSLSVIRTLKLQKEIEALKGRLSSYETENGERHKWIIGLNNSVKDREAVSLSQQKEIQDLKLEAKRKTLESNQMIATLENELALKKTEIQFGKEHCRDLEYKILNLADQHTQLEKKHNDENAYYRFEIRKLKTEFEDKEICNRVILCDLKDKLASKKEELQKLHKLHSRICQESNDRNNTISALKEIVQARDEKIECLKETVESLENKIQLDELRCSQLEIIIHDEIEDHEVMKEKFRRQLIQKLSNDESSKQLIGELLQEKIVLEKSLLSERMKVEECLEREKVLKESKEMLVVENQESLRRESQLIEVNNTLLTESESVEDLNSRNKELEKLLSQQSLEYEKQLVAVKEKFVAEIETLENEKSVLEGLLSKEKGHNNDTKKRENGLLKENNRMMLKNEALRHKSGKLEEMLTDVRKVAKEQKEIVERLQKANDELETESKQNRDLIEKQAREYNELWDRGRDMRHQNGSLVGENKHLKARFDVKSIECQKMACKIGQLRKEVNGGLVEMRHYQLQQNRLLIARDTRIEEYKDRLADLSKAVKVEKMVNQLLLKDKHDAKEAACLKQTEFEELQNKLKTAEEQLKKFHELENEKLKQGKCQPKDISNIAIQRCNIPKLSERVRKEVKIRPKSNAILTKMDVAQHKIAKQQQQQQQQQQIKETLTPLTKNLVNVKNKIMNSQNEDPKDNVSGSINHHTNKVVEGGHSIKVRGETDKPGVVQKNIKTEDRSWRNYVVVKLILVCIIMYIIGTLVPAVWLV
ncbi:putative leucine-rich repeat-containing protein DDB_G0290503 [Clytia hemisphaerica]